MTKILCVCNSGNVRSVCAARLLKSNAHGNHEAVAVGKDVMSQESLRLFTSWADLVFAFVDDLASAQEFCTTYEILVTGKPRLKFKYFDVGKDIWFDAFNVELTARMETLLSEAGF